MDRLIVYPTEQATDTDVLQGQKNAMVGIGGVLQAVLGTTTQTSDLACTQTTVASLAVLVGVGQIFFSEVIDATGYGSLAADSGTTVKQGFLSAPVTLATPAPGVAGKSINYLVQAAYADADTGAAVLNYYNAGTPSSPYSGPSNSGASQPTSRAGQCVVTVKAGTAANTGTQTTPSADANNVPLWVVTVANGQTTVTAGNIVAHASSPAIVTKLKDKASTAFVTAAIATAVAPLAPSASPVLTGDPHAPTAASGDADLTIANTAFVQDALQNSAANYAVDSSGAANTITVTLAPAPTVLSAGFVVRIKVANSNTGSTTVNPNGLGGTTVKRNGANLVGGELIAGQIYEFVCDGSNLHLMAESQVPNTGSGYVRLDGGLIMQWGHYSAAITTEATVTITFPIAFPNACLNMQATMENTSATNVSDYWTQIVSLSASSGGVFTQRASSGSGSATGFYWFAIGY